MHAHITCTPIKAWILVQMKVPAARPRIRRKVMNSNFFEILQILKALEYFCLMLLYISAPLWENITTFFLPFSSAAPLSPLCRSAKTLRGCLCCLNIQKACMTPGPKLPTDRHRCSSNGSSILELTCEFTLTMSSSPSSQAYVLNPLFSPLTIRCKMWMSGAGCCSARRVLLVQGKAGVAAVILLIFLIWANVGGEVKQ